MIEPYHSRLITAGERLADLITLTSVITRKKELIALLDNISDLKQKCYDEFKENNAKAAARFKEYKYDSTDERDNLKYGMDSYYIIGEANILINTIAAILDKINLIETNNSLTEDDKEKIMEAKKPDKFDELSYMG